MPGDYDSETPKLCRARCRHRRRHLFACDQAFVETLAGQGRGDNGRVRVVYARGPSNATAVGDPRI